MFLTKNLLRCVCMGMLAILLLRIGGASVLALSQSRGQWKVIPSPSGPPPFGSDLNAVAVVSTNDVWAVGYNLPGGSPFTTLIEHWDGTQWSVSPSPNPGAAGVQLYGVAAVSSTNIWAVGSYWANNTSNTLVEHWNGKQWGVIRSPTLAYDELLGITVISANDIWAVGYSLPISGAGMTLTEHWDGTHWSVVPSPNPPGSFGSELRAVAAVSTTNVWAVGDYGPCGLCNQPLVEHWDGKQWSLVSSPNAPGYAGLRGVAASGRGILWAVGYDTNGSGYYQTLIERGQGKTWSIVSSPNPYAGSNELYGISAVPGSPILWAVGYAGTQTLIEQWNGTTWKVVPSPSPGASGNDLSGVVASSARNVWAVGTYFPSSDLHQTLTEFYS